MTQKKYGVLPTSLGVFNITVEEMMFYLYLPISDPGMKGVELEPRITVFKSLVDSVLEDLGKKLVKESYIYLTAKRLWVTPGNPGNRPGWHSDGFGTDDINYIWCDCIPTVFNDTSFRDIEDDCGKSLEQFEFQRLPNNDVVFEPKTLLKLDQFVVHNTQ